MIFLVFFLYFIFIIFIAIGIFRLPKTDGTNHGDEKVTVVMAVKNEEKNIKETLDNLLNQTYNNLEFIIVDDNSSDKTVDFIKSSELFSTGRLKLLLANGQGKKRAIKQAVESATTDIILTADADVFYPKTWVSAMLNTYVKRNADLVLGPVKMSKDYPLQSMEYLSIMAVTAGSAGMKNPLMCNACSLMFSKTWYDKCDVLLDVPSGDDMFLLESTKKLDGTISYCNSAEAVVTIKGSESLKDFFMQRARWTSKAPHYTDISIILSGLIVFMMQAVMLMEYITTIVLWCKGFPYVGFLYWVVIKFIIDMIILLPVAIKFNLKSVLIYSPIVALIYPIYVVFTVTWSLFPKPMKWKIKWKN